jgi:hypothetical protein
VQHCDPRPYRGPELVGDEPGPLGGREVVARYEGVGRVHARPHPGSPHHFAQSVERRAELRPGPHRVLHHRFRYTSRVPGEGTGQISRPYKAVRQAVHALLFAVSAVAARVDDDEIYAERAGGHQLSRQGLRGALA